jgi:DNA-binding transcriptional ArsR family regulator
MIEALAALAEPNRLAMVELLRAGPRSVNGIVAELELRQPLVSKHLKVLSGAGLVVARPVAQQRIYELRKQGFDELDGWLASFAAVWDQRLDRLDAHVRRMTAETDETP